MCQSIIHCDLNIARNEPHVTLSISCAKRAVRLLLDSGASASFISSRLIRGGTRVNTNEKITAISATGHTVSTVASVVCSLFVNEQPIQHKMHIFDENISIAADGILGFDFMSKYKCIMNVAEKKICIKIEDDSRDQTLAGNECAEPTNGIDIDRRDQHKNARFTFPPKQFDTILPPQPTFNATKLQAYITCSQANEPFIIIRENAITYAMATIDAPDGDFYLNHRELLPNVSTVACIISSSYHSSFIPISNTNSFPLILHTRHMPIAQLISNISGYHLLHISAHADKQNRYNKIVDHINISQIDEETAGVIRHLCAEFSDCFHVDDDIVTHTDIIEHIIKLQSDAKPSFIKQYRLPESQKQEIQKQLNRMEQEGIIEKCQASGWNSPIILVPKKDGQGTKTDFRLVVDFRKLNEASIPIQFPIPQIHSIIDRLGKSKYFTSLDLYGAFYQLKLDLPSRNYTTFENNQFTYRFVSMPQGLHTSPAAMQNAVNLIFQDLLNKGVNVHLDDIIVYSETIETHISLLQQIFERLRRRKFKLKISKCQFFMRQIEYLGFIINSDGCSPNPAKIECINNYPPPSSVAELQRFLGLCNYFSHYVPNYAKIARPLYSLLRKGTAFDWDKSCSDAFALLKSKLTTAPILIFPDFHTAFIVTTDASDLAMLSQGDIPRDRPISYASKVLNAAQRNYSTIEKELYAIIYAIDMFRHYIYGFEFMLFTDHKPLIFLHKLKNPSGRLFRWKLKLSEYRYKIVYRKGTQNNVADALSRIVPTETIVTDLPSLLAEAKINALTRSKARQLEQTSPT